MKTTAGDDGLAIIHDIEAKEHSNVKDVNMIAIATMPIGSTMVTGGLSITRTSENLVMYEIINASVKRGRDAIRVVTMESIIEKMNEIMKRNGKLKPMITTGKWFLKVPQKI